jgi:transcriptional regulator with XRE-family HTH domain
MAATHPLLAALQRRLRRQGLTYADVARRLGVSEPTVKRLFSTERLTLDRLEALCEVAGTDLTTLAREAAEEGARLAGLTREQEEELVRDEVLLLCAVLVLNHWQHDQILAHYRIEPARLVRALAALDRLGLIDLLPGNRMRLKVARDFHWLPNGPIQRWFERHGQGDFLDANFTGDLEVRRFSNGMLSRAARARLLERIDRLCAEFAERHAEDAALPLEERDGACLLVAFRRWEPPGFAALRREA